jgi:hypothetical protein
MDGVREGSFTERRGHMSCQVREGKQKKKKKKECRMGTGRVHRPREQAFVLQVPLKPTLREGRPRRFLPNNE